MDIMGIMEEVITEGTEVLVGMEEDTEADLAVGMEVEVCRSRHLLKTRP